MPTLRIDMLEGRSAQTKQRLVTELTEVMVRVLGTDPGHVYVMLQDWAPTHWAVGGQFLGAPPAPGEGAATATDDGPLA